MRLSATRPIDGITACKWDVMIPFEPIWERLNKLIKPNGAIVLFGSEPFSSYLRLSNIKNYKYDWVWEKTKATGFANCKKQPMRIYEIISIFYKNQPTYNPQMTIGKPYTMKGGERKGSSILSGDKIRNYNNRTNIVSYFKSAIQNNGNRYPINIITFKKEGKLHPTQKPVALMEYLIKTYTNEDELVLDFTAGSFSTGVACINTNRNFIGIEISEKYCEIGIQRLNQATTQLKFNEV